MCGMIAAGYKKLFLLSPFPDTVAYLSETYSLFGAVLRVPTATPPVAPARRLLDVRVMSFGCAG